MADFYFVDWAASASQLISMELLARKRRSGWVWKIVATLCWMTFNIIVGSIPAATMSLVYIVMNIRGYRKWSEK